MEIVLVVCLFLPCRWFRESPHKPYNAPSVADLETLGRGPRNMKYTLVQVILHHYSWSLLFSIISLSSSVSYFDIFLFTTAVYPPTYSKEIYFSL